VGGAAHDVRARLIEQLGRSQTQGRLQSATSESSRSGAIPAVAHLRNRAKRHSACSDAGLALPGETSIDTGRKARTRLDLRVGRCGRRAQRSTSQVRERSDTMWQLSALLSLHALDLHEQIATL
jgi:hypothetical protein